MCAPPSLRAGLLGRTRGQGGSEGGVQELTAYREVASVPPLPINSVEGKLEDPSALVQPVSHIISLISLLLCTFLPV